MPVLPAIEFHRWVRPGATVVDCTWASVAMLGIARLLGPAGHLIGFDRDAEALARAKTRLERVSDERRARQSNGVPRTVQRAVPKLVQPASVDGMLADFGVSSLQLE